ncbi:MAG: response regulator [Ferruginibacter sp.]|nr:response regulator [Ferruginibacter sp.]
MEQAAHTPQNPLKILIIDDEGDTCFLLQSLLKEEPFEIEHVNTLGQADIFLKEETPSLIFLDNRLPDGLGMNFIADIRKHYPLTKIIMITGYSAGSDRKKALTKGADIFLPKPFTRQQVYSSVEELTGFHFNLKTA